MTDDVVTVEYSSAAVIFIRVGYDRATFSIHERPDNRYYSLGIEGTYGGFSSVWGSPGPSFKAFLAGMDLSYALKNFVGHDETFDGELTSKAIRKEIIELRLAGDCSPEEARDEWDAAKELENAEREYEFVRWSDNTQLFRQREPWHFQCSSPGRRTREFEGLWKKIWPVFRQELTR